MDVLAKGKETIVLELLRKGEISQGKAAELLGINRYEMFDLMARHDIPAFDYSVEELDKGMKTMDKLLKKKEEGETRA
jgi:predicted HTH domain antitoxin